MYKQQDCAQRGSNSHDPTADQEVRRRWCSPEKYTDKEKNEQSSPFKGPPCFGAPIGLTATGGAHPAFPKPKRKDGDPKDVRHVKRAYLDGAARLFARETVVVAKCHPFWTEVVDAVDYEHVNADILFHFKMAGTILRNPQPTLERNHSCNFTAAHSRTKKNTTPSPRKIRGQKRTATKKSALSGDSLISLPVSLSTTVCSCPPPNQDRSAKTSPAATQQPASFGQP